MLCGVERGAWRVLSWQQGTRLPPASGERRQRQAAAARRAPATACRSAAPRPRLQAWRGHGGHVWEMTAVLLSEQLPSQAAHAKLSGLTTRRPRPSAPPPSLLHPPALLRLWLPTYIQATSWPLCRRHVLMWGIARCRPHTSPPHLQAGVAGSGRAAGQGRRTSSAGAWEVPSWRARCRLACTCKQRAAAGARRAAPPHRRSLACSRGAAGRGARRCAWVRGRSAPQTSPRLSSGSRSPSATPASAPAACPAPLQAGQDGGTGGSSLWAWSGRAHCEAPRPQQAAAALAQVLAGFAAEVRLTAAAGVAGALGQAHSELVLQPAAAEERDALHRLLGRPTGR